MDLDVDNGKVRVGFLTFADGAVPAFHLNAFTSRDKILAAIDKVEYKPGATNTAEGFK